jgi:hypothetical protein
MTDAQIEELMFNYKQIKKIAGDRNVTLFVHGIELSQNLVNAGFVLKGDYIETTGKFSISANMEDMTLFGSQIDIPLVSSEESKDD